MSWAAGGPSASSALLRSDRSRRSDQVEHRADRGAVLREFGHGSGLPHRICWAARVPPMDDPPCLPGYSEVIDTGLHY